MTMKAMPVVALSERNNFSSGGNPPADNPMRTTGTELQRARLFATAPGRISDVFGRFCICLPFVSGFATCG